MIHIEKGMEYTLKQWAVAQLKHGIGEKEKTMCQMKTLDVFQSVGSSVP